MSAMSAPLAARLFAALGASPAFVDDVLDELGSRDAVNVVRWILENGTGADRQLRVYEESGQDLKAVVDYMIAETRHGL